jgi:regulation of enolase protein 1 (concanavalin A-like superfamily)
MSLAYDEFEDTITPPGTDDDFTGTDGAEPDLDRWAYGEGAQSTPYSPRNVEIQGNALRLKCDNGEREVLLRYIFDGDFDVQVDFNFPVYSATEGWGGGFVVRCLDNWADLLIWDKGVSASTQRYRLYCGGDRAVYNSTEQSGKLRLVRSGSQFTAYRWTGSDWASIGSYTPGWGAEKVIIGLWTTHWGSNPNTTTDFDNFQVNSGSCTYQGMGTAWAFRQGSGGAHYQESGVHHIISGPGDCWTTYDPTMLWQALTNDFDVWTKMIVPPELNANYEQTGLLFAVDEDNFVRLVRDYDSGHKLSLTHMVANSPVQQTIAMTATTIWLRLKRVGTAFTAYYATASEPLQDGDWTEFTFTGTKLQSSADGKIGLLAGHPTSLNQFDVQFEYFRPWPYIGGHKPNTPSISKITKVYRTTCALNGSPFSDPDNDQHSRSQWQVDLQTGDFSSPVHDSGESTDLTAHDVTGLTEATDYKARVRYKDDSGEPATEWSEWSSPYDFSTSSGTWSGIEFIPSPEDGAVQIRDEQPITCAVLDNWYPFADADIKITVEGVQYTNADPEISFEDLAYPQTGRKIIFTLQGGNSYGRVQEINCRVDAKNSNNDESYVEWAFTSFGFATTAPAETVTSFHEPVTRGCQVSLVFQQLSSAAAQPGFGFRFASGILFQGKAIQTVFGIVDRILLAGECEPTLFLCELKRTFGQGDANVAEVGTLAGEASANVYGQYLVIAGGDAGIRAFQIFVMPGGAGNIQVAIVRQGEASGNIGIPSRIAGEGSARLFKVEGTTYLRVNALPDAIKQALQDAGIIINV